MKSVIAGITRFQSEVYPQHKEQFEELASGQSPEVLMIACADSRVDPNLITQSSPGDLFVCRNAGNVVPPHSNATSGMTASIEFAVLALGVSHAVVCGHSDCGAMKGAMNPGGLDGVPHVKDWLGHCRAAADVVHETCGDLDASRLKEVTLENIKLQLAHLRTHPAIAARMAAGKMELHGWYYDIGTGEVLCYDQDSDSFLPADERYEHLMDAPAVSAV